MGEREAGSEGGEGEKTGTGVDTFYTRSGKKNSFERSRGLTAQYEAWLRCEGGFLKGQKGYMRREGRKGSKIVFFLL